jgi:amino acid transporter
MHIALIFAWLVCSYFPKGVAGVLSGSATLFFAYIGFDAVASTAEEVGFYSAIY